MKNKKPKLVDYLGTNFAEFSMLLFAIFYSAYSMRSNLNIGIRHLLPIMPFLYILTSIGLKSWLKRDSLKTQIKFGLIALMVIWYVAETAIGYPYYLSYFNEAIGTSKGWQYVTDSNYDWGQDLKRLKEFVENSPNGEKIDKIAVDYFGGGDPRYYLGNKFEGWWSAKGDPRESNIHWLAISINTIQGARGKLHPGQTRNIEDEYLWLKTPYEPYARAGTSIFIYKLNP